MLARSCRIGRSTLDAAREALAEYLALLSPTPLDDEEEEDTDHPVDLEKSLKGTLKLYGRAVDVLRQKRERELLTEALCDMGDLHVRKFGILAFVIQGFIVLSVAGGFQSLVGVFRKHLEVCSTRVVPKSTTTDYSLAFAFYLCISWIP